MDWNDIIVIGISFNYPVFYLWIVLWDFTGCLVADANLSANSSYPIIFSHRQQQSNDLFRRMSHV
jgi:hypothetical protein